MARTVLILAKSIREAGTYARLAGLKRGTYRPVAKGAQIRAVRAAEIHILPSFTKAPSRHAILAALRYSRHEIFYVDPADFAESEFEFACDYCSEKDPHVHTPEDAQIRLLGDLTERQLEVAYRYNSLRDQAIEDQKTKIHVFVVPDDTEPPQSHTDLVERVMPTKIDIGALSAANIGDGAISSSQIQANVVELPVVEVPDAIENAPAEKPVQRRRTRCATCTQLHFKDEACPTTSEDMF